MTICFEQEDQRQAPVAAEKQRSVTHWCPFPDAGVRSDRMQQLLSGAIPCADSIEDGDHVNEMAIQRCRCDASAVLWVRQKRKRNDFWLRKSPGWNESAAANPDQDTRCTDLARRWRSWPAKTFCACEGSKNLVSLPPFPRRPIFFSTTRTSTCWNSATIRRDSFELA